MAHMIANVNGRNSIAFVGQVPWHGLGQQLTEGEGLDVWARESGMGFQVERAKVKFGTAEGLNQVWDGRHVLYRSDNRAPLAVVSDRYQIVQPAEVLEFFRDLCAKQGMTMNTAGVLDEGQRYWALASLGKSFTLAGGDVVSGYMLLATSCDGSLATVAKITSIRVVCNNTLEAANQAGGKHCVRVRHSSVFRETQVKMDMGLIGQGWDAFAENARALSARRISQKEAAGILIRAMGDPKKTIEDQPNMRPMAQILALFDGDARGSALPSACDTAWGLVNAATEHADHFAGRSDNSRLNSAWFGSGANRKAAVYREALALALAG